jgi:hypothetical protein
MIPMGAGGGRGYHLDIEYQSVSLSNRQNTAIESIGDFSLLSNLRSPLRPAEYVADAELAS